MPEAQQLPPLDSLEIKKDRFSKSRGGKSKVLTITCTGCNEVAGLYQKDGPGTLVRCYKDRFLFPESLQALKDLVCGKCGQLLGSDMIYEPESRPAFRLIRGKYQQQGYKKTTT
ncbi:hypothetical protein KA057_02330 [Candidatus Gracilibacteria bacterium]|nr:hypothetical protein [Candidatus Gracilibacteria bacterium]